ncbi:hypothetical protein ACFC0S_00595 [Streptomyces sp. NPDC056084]|uniref:hypothetical protein n=1 Tax=unclassified Streptomyces TaxID=2593676 RepID=UPI0035DB4BEF
MKLNRKRKVVDEQVVSPSEEALFGGSLRYDLGWNHGRVVESGTFNDLLSDQAAGVFRGLYELQAAQYRPTTTPDIPRPTTSAVGEGAEPA